MRTLRIRTHTAFVCAFFWCFFSSLPCFVFWLRDRRKISQRQPHTIYTLRHVLLHARRNETADIHSFGISHTRTQTLIRTHTHTPKITRLILPSCARVSRWLVLPCKTRNKKMNKTKDGVEQTRCEFYILSPCIHNLLPHCSRSQANKRHTDKNDHDTAIDRCSHSPALTQEPSNTVILILIRCELFLFFFSSFPSARLGDTYNTIGIRRIITIMYDYYSSIGWRVCNKFYLRSQRKEIWLFSIYSCLFCAFVSAHRKRLAVVHLSFCIAHEFPYTRCTEINKRQPQSFFACIGQSKLIV